MGDNENIPHTDNLLKINVKDLKVGMYVSKLDRSWLESSFLFQGFELKKSADIKEVQKQCQFVYIDIEKQSKSIKLDIKVGNWIDKSKAPKRTSSFKEEFTYAQSVFHETSDLVKGFMETISLGRAINVEIAKKAVAECVQSVIKSPDALMWLTQLKNKDEYTAQHSMNVCILAIALGRQINLPEESLEQVGLCGMMHDMGKMKVPLGVLNKPGRFNDEEREVMNSHTTLGWKMLMEQRGMPGIVIDTAYTHHERLDGKGYPRGLTAEKIPLFVRIVTIVDMYDAIASDRVYKKGKTHLEAIKIMTQSSGTQLDSKLVMKFIESLGIYPPGNIVEMTNGEVAVVIESHPTKKLKPKITMLLDVDKKRVRPRLVDLSKIDLDPEGNSYQIKKIIRPDDYDIDMALLYKMGASTMKPS
jgi:putative nucleotidyltransferase with HDIG domain